MLYKAHLEIDDLIYSVTSSDNFAKTISTCTCQYILADFLQNNVKSERSHQKVHMLKNGRSGRKGCV